MKVLLDRCETWPFYLSNALFQSLGGIVVVAISPFVNMIYWPVSAKIDKIGLDPYSLNLNIFRPRANFLTANMDSESPGHKLSINIRAFGIGGSHFFTPYLSGCPGPKTWRLDDGNF